MQPSSHQGSSRPLVRSSQPPVAQPAVKAACSPRMACRPCRLHLHPDRVLIAIHQQFDHLLHVAGGAALVPDLLPGTRPVMRLAGSDGLLQTRCIVIGNHTHNTHPAIGCNSLRTPPSAPTPP